MNLKELLENANLASLGLLDPDDHHAFEASLARAPKKVRDRVLAEQARFAGGAGLLPDVEPPVVLKGRVLDGIHAIASDGAAIEEALVAVGPSRVSRWWRASSIGLVTAALVLAGTSVYVFRHNNALETRLAEGAIKDAITTAFAADFGDMLFNSATTRTILRPGASGFEGRVAVFSSENWENTRVFADNLAALEDGKVYALVEVRASGEVTELKRLDAKVQPEVYTVDRPLARGSRLALVVTEAGRRAQADDKVLMTATV
ncbi:MAG TPA: hypothetical protein VD971_02305 [Phycisphaerales bacterium]|nr:hypothetical protein [Phycisphaerales bacterium]